MKQPVIGIIISRLIIDSDTESQIIEIIRAVDSENVVGRQYERYSEPSRARAIRALLALNSMVKTGVQL